MLQIYCCGGSPFNSFEYDLARLARVNVIIHVTTNLLFSVVQMAIVKVFNGIGLAMVVPAIQSLVADSHKENARGLGFGWLHAAGQFGTLTGGVFATLLAGYKVGSLPGWRFAFFAVAILSLLLAAAIYTLAQDVKPPPVSAGTLVRWVKY